LKVDLATQATGIDSNLEFRARRVPTTLFFDQFYLPVYICCVVCAQHYQANTIPTHFKTRVQGTEVLEKMSR